MRACWANSAERAQKKPKNAQYHIDPESRQGDRIEAKQRRGSGFPLARFFAARGERSHRSRGKG
ncbi:unnamed protein product, partial [Musa acuminata subsp. burmannicoides]